MQRVVQITSQHFADSRMSGNAAYGLPRYTGDLDFGLERTRSTPSVFQPQRVVTHRTEAENSFPLK